VKDLVNFVHSDCVQRDQKIKTTTTSELTWLEEWFFYFEMVWGKSLHRWIDAQATYKLTDKLLREVFDNKLSMVLNVRNTCWPLLATQEECLKYRNRMWDEYNGTEARIIMWDNTNINMFKPSSSHSQRCTYSLYYSGNVGKGSVFIQPCGWMGSHEVCMGAVSDTDYFNRSGMSKIHETYQPDDPSTLDK
jgi:hypothetical protein